MMNDDFYLFLYFTENIHFLKFNTDVIGLISYALRLQNEKFWPFVSRQKWNKNHIINHQIIH